MSKVFRITPKRFKRANGTVLTPDMVITHRPLLQRSRGDPGTVYAHVSV